jgi:signal transduction histidine kinase
LIEDGGVSKRADILSRVYSLMFEPHPAILGRRRRQQALYLSILSALAVPVFFVTQFGTDLTTLPIYHLASIAYLAVYFLSRTQWYDLTAAVSVSIASLLPIGLFSLGEGWLATDLPRILVWVTMSLLVGAIFIQPRYVIIQYSMIVAVLLSASLIQFQLLFNRIIEFYLLESLIAGMIIISAYMVHDYARKSDEQYTSLEKKRWELEVYTQLLRHDIRNDLHALLGSVELAEMLMPANPDRATEQLLNSLKVGANIVGLLDAFSSYSQDVEMNLVGQIEQVAAEAMEVYKGLTIDIASTKRAREVESASNKLMPMVWMNIFRNSVQHAGPSPHVEVSVFDLEDSLKITSQDNGAGISEDDKEWIFARGNPADSANRGMGMYLARIIIESHGGTIEIVENVGCKIEINLPL